MAVFCNHDAPAAENYVKSWSTKCQIHKKMLGQIPALNYVTFGKILIIIHAFCVFMGKNPLFGYSSYSRCTEVWKNFKAHAKLCTLKQFLERSWYYTMSCLTSIDTKYFFLKYQYWWLLLRKLLKITHYMLNSMKSLS